MAVKLYEKTKYELMLLLLFAVVAVFNREIPGTIVPVSVSYYLADYSIGFCSRLLIASIVNIFNKSPSVEWLTGFSWAVVVFTFILISVLIGRVIRSAQGNVRSVACITAVLFATGPFTVLNYLLYLGYLDIYWLIFALFSVLFVGNKYLRWLIPLFSVLGVCVNYGYLITYFPLVCCALLYLIIKEKAFVSGSILTLLTVAFSVIATVYFLFYSSSTLTLSLEQFHEYLASKFSGPLDTSYLDYYLYGVALGETYSSPAEMLGNITSLVASVVVNKLLYLELAVIFLPLSAVFTFIWVRAIRSSERKADKFMYFVFAAAQLAVIPSAFISTDIGRWVQSTVITQFVLLFLMIYKKDAAVGNSLERISAFFRLQPTLGISAFVLYCATAFSSVSSF